LFCVFIQHVVPNLPAPGHATPAAAYAAAAAPATGLEGYQRLHHAAASLGAQPVVLAAASPTAADLQQSAVQAQSKDLLLASGSPAAAVSDTALLSVRCTASLGLFRRFTYDESGFI